jgi:hypothetical protein
LRTFALRQDRIGDGNAAKKCGSTRALELSMEQLLQLQAANVAHSFWSFPIELHAQWSDSLADFWRLQKGREFWLNSGRMELDAIGLPHARMLELLMW